MSSRIFTRNAFETGLDGGISDSETTITLDTTVGLSFPGILVVNDDDPVLREYVEYTGISTNDLTGCTRGGEGSAGGTAHAHSTGARVRSVYTHQVQDRIWDDIESLETADTTHAAAGDPHTGYVLESAHDKAQHDAFGLDHGLLSGLTDDDHTQYHTDARAVTWLGTRSVADLGTKDHDLLDGLADDDHTQYHTDARAGVWLETQSIADLGPSSISEIGTRQHDLLNGLGDDDHTQYLLTSGARAMAGNLAMGSNKITGLPLTPIDLAEAASKDYVDDHVKLNKVESDNGQAAAEVGFTALDSYTNIQAVTVTDSGAQQVCFAVGSAGFFMTAAPDDGDFIKIRINIDGTFGQEILFEFSVGATDTIAFSTSFVRQFNPAGNFTVNLQALAHASGAHTAAQFRYKERTVSAITVPNA